MGENVKNKIVIEGDLVKIHLVGKYNDRVALTDLKSFLKYELDQYIWRSDKLGYVYTTQKGKVIYIHRLIMNNQQKGLYTDHINNSDDPIADKLDNRRSNLRFATNRLNQMNSRLKKTNSTGYKGVNCNFNNYNVHSKVNRHKYYFGSFNKKKFENALIMAAYCYDIASEWVNGEFAQHNEIKQKGLLSVEEMKVVEEITYRNIERHGLPKYKKIEAPDNVYTGVLETVGIEA